MTTPPDTQGNAKDIAQLRSMWLGRERRREAANAKLAVSDAGELAAEARGHAPHNCELMRDVDRASPIIEQDLDAAARAFTRADRSAVVDLARQAERAGDGAQDTYAATVVYAAQAAQLDRSERAAATTFAAAPPEMVSSAFDADYSFFHDLEPEHVTWPSDDELLAAARRHPGPTPLPTARPSISRLADLLERAQRVDLCRSQTRDMLAQLQSWMPAAIFANVRVGNVSADFMVVAPSGVFLVWSIDHRWTVDEARMVLPARAQIRAELGDDYNGEVEAILHSPRETPTAASRQVLIDETSSEPLDIVIATGRLEEILRDWVPANDVWLDPTFPAELYEAAAPDWTRSADGLRHPPPPPPHDAV